MSKHMQVGGDHYRKQEIQPWEIMKAWYTREEFEAYMIGNIIKYVSRYRMKNGVQDLQKAKHYLDEMITTYHEDK